MKKIYSIISCLAIASMAFVGCQQEIKEEIAPAKNTITLNFAAETADPASTKATLTPNDGETAFAAAWENTDQIGIYAVVGEDYTENTIGTFNGSDFSASITGTSGAEGLFCAAYPYSADATIEFGSDRTQDGNAYNSKYDVMYADGVEATLSDNGTIALPMHRQTAIAYFHLAGTPAVGETVQSATLTIDADENNPAKIAGDISYVDGEITTDGTSNSITITFAEGTNPSADDFTLWFNVLPVSYKTLKLEVTTENYTLTINNTTAGSYVAGKLYKVSANAQSKWDANTPASQSYSIVFGSNATGNTQIQTSTKASTVITEGAEYVTGQPFSSITASYYGDNKTSIRVGKSNGAGSLTIALSEDGQVNATSIVVNAYLYSSTKVFGLGINGAAYQNIGAEAADYTFDLDGDKISSITIATGGYIFVNSITVNYGGTVKAALASPTNLAVDASTKVVSWTAVENAGSYLVTIGDNEPVVATTNSYDATAIADEYYDVSVVAVPTDTDTYKNSDAATLKGAKFGDPWLTTPVLSAGAIDESSITVTWTKDARATNGYEAVIYKDMGDGTVRKLTNTDSDQMNIMTGTATFTGLEADQAYEIRVMAMPVTEPRAYHFSSNGTIILTTIAAQHVSDVTEAGNYTIKGLTVYASNGTNQNVVGDGTGYILDFGSQKTVGEIYTIAGNVEQYRGIWQFKSATGNKTGETQGAVTYPSPIEFTASEATSYIESPYINYVHFSGTADASTGYISVGDVKMNVYTTTKGKTYDVLGFTIGYSADKDPNYISVIPVTLTDQTPTLSVTPTSKTWAYDETAAATFNVSAAFGTWSVDPTTLDWATVAIDATAGTITVTPNGQNTSEADYEATLTVVHSADASLTKTITLKQTKEPVGGITATLQLSSSKKFGTTSGSTLNDDKGNVWTCTGTSIQNSYQSTYSGQQFGTSSTNYVYTFTSPFSGKTISSITIKAAAGGTTATYSIKVGDTVCKSGNLSKTPTDYSCDVNASGSITVTLDQNSGKKAVYLNSITVVYK